MFGRSAKVSDELPSSLRAFRISYARTETWERGGFRLFGNTKVSLAGERCPFKSIVSKGPLATRLCTMSDIRPRARRFRAAAALDRNSGEACRALDEHPRTTLVHGARHR